LPQIEGKREKGRDQTNTFQKCPKKKKGGEEKRLRPKTRRTQSKSSQRGKGVGPVSTYTE